MKRKLRTWCTLLTAILLLAALGGCGAVDKGLLSKTVSAFDELETLNSVGWRRETYLSEAGGEESQSQSTEIWVRQVEEVKDWYIDSQTYDADGAVQLNSELAKKNGVAYRRFSIGGEAATWEQTQGATDVRVEDSFKIDFMDSAEHYEFFRKEKDGSITFAYSQAGLDAYHALLGEEAQSAEILTEVDGKPLSEEQVAAQEQSRAVNIAMAEQTKITALSGAFALDEAGKLLRYQLQIAGEAPELEPDGEGGWTVISTRVGEMRTVIEILAYADIEVEQKLVELFADLPK